MRTTRKETESPGTIRTPDVKPRRSESMKGETLSPMNCGSISTFPLPDIKPEDVDILARCEVAAEITRLEHENKSLAHKLAYNKKRLEQLQKAVRDPSLIETRECKFCGEEFIPGSGIQVFCKKSCYRKYNDRKARTA